MIECGAYGERMAGYLHLAEPPIFAALGSGRSELAVTRLHTPNGFTDPTSAIPSEKAFSIHLHLRANHGGCLWLCGRLVPTGKRPSGAVTIPDFEQDPIAFFPNWSVAITVATLLVIDSKVHGGETGIRTLDTLRYTRFPSVRLKPLGHLSGRRPTF
jgi:hypothetical protein